MYICIIITFSDLTIQIFILILGLLTGRKEGNSSVSTLKVLL